MDNTFSRVLMTAGSGVLSWLLIQFSYATQSVSTFLQLIFGTGGIVMGFLTIGLFMTIFIKEK